MNSNDSDDGDTDSEEDELVENVGSHDVGVGTDSESSSDSEDDEPLAKLAGAKVPGKATKTTKVSKKHYSWNKRTFTHMLVHSQSQKCSDGIRRQNHSLKSTVHSSLSSTTVLWGVSTCWMLSLRNTDFSCVQGDGTCTFFGIL